MSKILVKSPVRRAAQEHSTVKAPPVPAAHPYNRPKGDGVPPATGTRCVRCGKRFRRTGGFDAHRTGKYETRGYNGRILIRCSRRCMTEAEMQRAGFTLSDGFWGRRIEWQGTK